MKSIFECSMLLLVFHVRNLNRPYRYRNLLNRPHFNEDLWLPLIYAFGRARDGYNALLGAAFRQINLTVGSQFGFITFDLDPFLQDLPSTIAKKILSRVMLYISGADNTDTKTIKFVEFLIRE